MKTAVATVLIGLVITFSGCTPESAGGRFEPSCDCSLIHLIASPKKYDGREVRVIGLALSMDQVLMSGVGRIYLSKDDARVGNNANSIVVDIRESALDGVNSIAQFDGSFVVVDGTFSYEDGAGFIRSISRIAPLDELPLDASRFRPGL